MSKIIDDKTLTPAEQTRLREFVQEVWTTAYWDTEGVTGKLGEEAEVCAEILGFKVDQRPEPEDDLDDEFPEPVQTGDHKPDCRIYATWSLDRTCNCERHK